LDKDNQYLRPPIALISTGEEWLSLSVETLFSPRGYAVVRAFSGIQALQRVRDTPPDLIVASRDLRDIRGIDLCQAIYQDPIVSRGTPIMLIASSPWEREERLEALRAGAWDVCSLPMDGEELFLRVNAWVQAKVESDATREQSLLDGVTGMYNTQGLLRRIMEIAATAGRYRRPLGCVVIGLDLDETSVSGSAARPGRSMDATASFVSQLRSAGRASDTLGRLNETEFVVLAPDTDADGVLRLAHRLKGAMETAPSGTAAPVKLRFGCYAVPNFRDASIAPAEMMIRAAEALRGADSTLNPIRLFERPLDHSN
jgi:diguanylate cyclase (GGDEF)-like protein